MGDEHFMSEENQRPKETAHDVFIVAVMPGQKTASTYKISVMALSNADAVVKGEAEWYRATQPRDIRVKAVEPVTTAPG
jgi:hypothetical protein